MNIAFNKENGLVPAIVQDAETKTVLMLAYMNEEAYKKTMETGKVTFYSRSRKSLWTKGETSGNFLYLISIAADCDSDTLLIKVRPQGPACHTGADTCFNEKNESSGFLKTLENIITERRNNPKESSYTTSLFIKGTAKIAQKVGEEAVETIIEAMKNDKERLKEESADLLYHLIVLLSEKHISLWDVEKVLEKRHG